MSNSPRRKGSDNVPSIADAFERIFQISCTEKPDTVLAALERSLKAPGNRAIEHDELIEALNAGAKPNSLCYLSLDRVKVHDSHSHESAPDWRFGTAAARHELMLTLFAAAKEFSKSDSKKAAKYARASALLALQDTFPYGTAAMWKFFHDAQFEELTGWPGQQIAAMREHLARDRSETARFTRELLEAGKALSALIVGQDPDSTSNYVDRLMIAMEAMAATAGNRYELHRRHADLTWRFACLARSRGWTPVLERLRSGAQGWARHSQDPTVSRWLNEATNEPGPAPSSPGFVMISSRIFKQLRDKASRNGARDR